MAKRLTDEQWKAIRHSWEYDPDQPSVAEAGKRAGKKFDFTPPAKQVIDRRCKAEKWSRKAMAGMAAVNAAAQRKADKVPSGGSGEGVGVAQGDGKGAASPTKKAGDPAAAVSSVEEAEDLRAKVIARHRQEWEQVAQLRQEAIKKRHHPTLNPAGNTATAFESAKLAKITAEMTAIQQAGERKAWGLDVVVDPDQLTSLSDEDLKAIASGKMPARR